MEEEKHYLESRDQRNPPALLYCLEQLGISWFLHETPSRTLFTTGHKQQQQSQKIICNVISNEQTYLYTFHFATSSQHRGFLTSKFFFFFFLWIKLPIKMYGVSSLIDITSTNRTQDTATMNLSRRGHIRILESNESVEYNECNI